MQNHMRKDSLSVATTLISRLSALGSPRGQLFTTCCAYSALTCQTISLLLIDYTRLSLPFGIAVLPLSCLGIISRSRRSFARLALALWVVSANVLVSPLFNLNEQFTLMPRMQQQVIQLENQNNHLNTQYSTLLKQTTILQSILGQELSTTKHKDPALEKKLFGVLSPTFHAYTQIQNSLPATNAHINLSAAYLEYGNRNFLDYYWVHQYYQQSITSNDNQIRANQRLIESVNQIIKDNNALIPPPNFPFAPWVDQKTCVSGYPCIQLSWQQPFIDGWHNITTEPLSTTWFFWLSLLIAVPGIFLILPGYEEKLEDNYWKVSYRLLYAGPLSHLDDPAFPDQQREVWPPETSILKITITSTQFLRKKDDMGKDIPNLPSSFRIVPAQDKMYGDAQDFLYLNLGLGSTVHDVFLAQETRQNAQDASTVSYDSTTGNIVARVKPTVPIEATSVGQYWNLRKNTAARQFPIQFYVVIDSFAGSLDAATPIATINQLREERGPKGFIKLINSLQGLLSFFYFGGFLLALQISSSIFFAGPAYLPYLSWFVLGWLIAVLVFQVPEIIFARIAIRRPNLLPLDSLVS
jgi:hypothetical protein